MIHASTQQFTVDNEEEEGPKKGEERGVKDDYQCDVYEGEWMDGKAHGTGEYFNSNGTTYKGSWMADR